MMQYDDDVEES